jgi:6-phosphofructokinase 1
MSTAGERAIGVLTSGGDAPGMNAAVRAVVRTALNRGVPVFAIRDGFQGMVHGAAAIVPMDWDSVGGIMQRGGTIIGTARCEAFRSRDGRREAARHLVERGIDRLIVIGGDGSLTGAHTFREEWASLLEELVVAGTVPAEARDRHPFLSVVGLVGSIDNDMVGIDMTIGADTALHRITDALDALGSTAASHQRAFVVEVMGRRCGYLGLMGGLAGGADWVFVPEDPPAPGWEQRLAALVREGRAAGRRDCIVVVSEGAIDADHQPITCDRVRQALEQGLGEDVRVTILGHVQRGGAPSAFDRWMSTVAGAAAVDAVLEAGPSTPPEVIGLRLNRVTRVPLVQAVDDTRAVARHLEGRDIARVQAMRGGSFAETRRIFWALAEALPSVQPFSTPRRVALMHADGPAPGMNTIVRAAVRLGIDQGLAMFGVRGGIEGLIEGRLERLEWGSVDGWNARGGAELGTSRLVPDAGRLQDIARHLEAHGIGALVIAGGWSGYEVAEVLATHRHLFRAFEIPIVCVPATINNDLPASELSVGADSALNLIVNALDRIKQSAVAVQRCFVVEVMGRHCGYLALLGGLGSGAERVYIHERRVRLDDLQRDVAAMTRDFERGKRLSLVVRNEGASQNYTTEFMAALFEEEGQSLFDVRRTVLGHVQQGGDPSPFDRIQATRLAAHAVHLVCDAFDRGRRDAVTIGLVGGRVATTPLAEALAAADRAVRRPREQWWLDLESLVRDLAHPQTPPDDVLPGLA